MYVVNSLVTPIFLLAFRHGFLLPANRVKKTVNDTHSGVVAMLRKLVRE